MTDSLVVDVGTYAAPAMELIYESGVPDFRAHWDRVLPEIEVAYPRRGTGDWELPYLVLKGERPWPDALRHNGEEPVVADHSLEPGVMQDNASGRLRAMDRLGVDVHLINPAPQIGAVRRMESAFAAGVLGAYNRYAISYCDTDPSRLKVALQLHGLEPEWSAGEIRELASEPCVAAVSIYLPVKSGPESARFAAVWQALEDAQLPLLHRASFSSPVWTPRQVLSYFTYTQILDRYEGLRIGFSETGLDWVPGLVAHMNEAIEAPHRVSEYVEQGRIFAVADPTDDDAAIERAAAEFGRDALLSESYFPYRPAEADGSVGRADLARNGGRFLRLQIARPKLARLV